MLRRLAQLVYSAMEAVRTRISNQNTKLQERGRSDLRCWCTGMDFYNSTPNDLDSESLKGQNKCEIPSEEFELRWIPGTFKVKALGIWRAEG